MVGLLILTLLIVDLNRRIIGVWPWMEFSNDISYSTPFSSNYLLFLCSDQVNLSTFWWLTCALVFALVPWLIIRLILSHGYYAILSVLIVHFFLVLVCCKLVARSTVLVTSKRVNLWELAFFHQVVLIDWMLFLLV